MFDLKNDDGTGNHNLYPISGAWAYFSRCRILAHGQVLEDIDNYNRVHEMIECMSTTDNNDYGEGFGNYWRNESSARTLLTNNKSLTSIPPSSSMTVIFKPIAGLFQSVRKYLPLQFMPITIELSLVDNPLDPIIFTDVRDPGDGIRIANSFLYTCFI